MSQFKVKKKGTVQLKALDNDKTEPQQYSRCLKSINKFANINSFEMLAYLFF